MPLQVYNATNDTRELRLELLETAGDSVLFSADARVDAQRSASVPSAQVPHGEYAVRATAGQVTREVEIQFRHESLFFRFVVQDDRIGFQSG